MGEAARERVRDLFLGPRHLRQYVDLLERAICWAAEDGRSEPTGSRSGRPEKRRLVAKVGTDRPVLAHRRTERDELDDIALESDHGAEGLLVHRPDRPQPETGGQHAVVRGRRSASLDVTQHGRTRLVARALFECGGDDLADAAELGVTERIDLAARDGEGAFRRDGALGDDDDRRVATLAVTLRELGGDVVDVERLLGSQDHGAAAGNAGIQCDPAGVPAHHLDRRKRARGSAVV